MSEKDGKRRNYKHLTVSELSRLVSGRIEDRTEERLRKHLDGCDRCMRVYRESVFDCGLAETDRSVHREIPELVEKGLEIAVRCRSGELYGTRRKIRSTLSAPVFISRYIASVAALALVVIAGAWLLRTGWGEDPQVPRSVLYPIRHAVGTISRRGPIIMHGGEYAVGQEGAAYRTGFVPATNPLRSSLDFLYERYENDSASPEGMYWLAAGYVATGQIDLARDLVADARKSGFDDLRMQNLEALIAYIKGDLDRSEGLFRSINTLYRNDAVSSINFAVVLMERGESEESSRILTGVIEQFQGTAFADRAQVLLDTE